MFRFIAPPAPPGSRIGLRVAGVILLAVVTAITGGCGPSHPPVALDDSAKAEFARLCGTIGIKIGWEDPRRYAIRGGEVARVDSLPAAPREASGGDSSGVSRLTGVDRIESAYVQGAYLVSPDRRLLAVELDYHRGTQGLAIVELDTQRSTPSWFPATWKRVVAEVEPPWGVRGFAWAPDSAHLAVLEASRDPKYWLVDLLVSMLHPYGHHLFALEVYARSGQRVARSSLTRQGEGVPFSSGEVVWFDGCGAAS